MSEVIETRDSEGTLIEVGQAVAFNLSGEVVRGEVVNVGTPRRISQWYVKYSVRIKGPRGKISHVRNNRCILVI